MKIKTTVAALSILSVLSFGAFAADSINSEQAQGRQAIGHRFRRRGKFFPDGYA
ncbi:protein YcfR [Klebsiella oxytoca]|nr:protein YcfR [Klebsiella oxytoca]